MNLSKPPCWPLFVPLNFRNSLINILPPNGNSINGDRLCSIIYTSNMACTSLLLINAPLQSQSRDFRLNDVARTCIAVVDYSPNKCSPSRILSSFSIRVKGSHFSPILILNPNLLRQLVLLLPISIPQ